MKMQLRYIAAILGLVGCGSPPSTPITTGPRIVTTPAECARKLSDGRFINDKLGVGCHFAKLNGARVCIPDGLAVVTAGSCIPNGIATGVGKVQIDLSADGCGGKVGRYVLFPTDKTAPLVCDDYRGSIRAVTPALSADQQIYFGADNKNCTRSPLAATADYPFVDLVGPSVVLYEDDFPSTVCPGNA